MLVGYARTSTIEQEAGLEAQERDLRAAGCEEMFAERVSSTATRPRLGDALRFVRKGDTLIVTKVDRLARSIIALWGIVEELEEKGAALRVLNLGGGIIDTSSATDRLVLNIFAGFAQFEREMMLERQKEGIAKAKALGRYRGRKPTAREKAGEVCQLADLGITRTAIAQRLGISVASVYRALKSRGAVA